ncbi:hypothetical protein E8A73_005295 [Polyangium aurulentum]|nr:hypothetical protein E8A73_005295 [Polyangium aurulentum]
MGCHSTGNIAPFGLTTYEQAKPLAAMIASTTRAGTMPPFAVQNTDECTTRHAWKGDVRLSDEEIAILEAWNKAGAPKGDPKDAPPAFVPKSPDLPGKNLEIQPKTSFVTSGDKDQFRCFVMDPGLTEDRYMNGLQVVPGNYKVVHHAVVAVDPTRQIEQLAGPDGSFECAAGALMSGGGGGGGGGGAGAVGLVNAWAPGADPVDLPEGVGYLIPKGSLILMQIHYHPGGVTADPDLTSIQLRLTEEKPKYRFDYRLLGNFEQPVEPTLGIGLLPGPDDDNGVEFLIPADSPSHVETQQYTVPALDSPLPDFIKLPAGARIYGDWLHMHYLGFDEKVTLTRASAAPDKPAEECLAHAPQWDFSWQRSYTYDAPIEELPTIEPGDVLKIRCKYNNTKDNPYVVQALQEAHMTSTIDVQYGEGSTFDEMCVVGLSLIYPMP